MSTTSNYTFKKECDCGNKPILKDLGMCSVCTFGEASSMWDWLDDKWSGKERKLAEKHILEILHETQAIDDEGNFDAIVASLLHIDQDVVNKMERVME